MHWVEKYLGKPWSATPKAPDSYHCWSLIQTIQKDEYGRECPSYDLISPTDFNLVSHKMETESKGLKWVQIPEPVDGCIVALSTKTAIHHVGNFVEAPEGGRVIHCDTNGVQIETFTGLRKQGYQRILFYVHKSWPHT